MSGDEGMPGVMPRALCDVFDLAKAEDDYAWRFSMTYVEIYNERVKDLLNPMSGVDLDVREDARKGTVIAGAVEVAVGSLHEVMELMNKGSLYRTTEATNCNEVSSRSHAVLQLHVESAPRSFAYISFIIATRPSFFTLRVSHVGSAILPSRRRARSGSYP